MKCKLLALILTVSLLLVGCNRSAGEDSLFYFDPQVYENVSDGCGGDRNVPRSLADLEKMTKYHQEESKSTAAIFQCVVSGPSINRIMEPPFDQWERGVTYGVNHVLTPVTITDIFYAGEDVDLVVGETYYLLEPFFYITEETPDYLEYHGHGTIAAQEYTPIQRGNEYIVFGRYEHNEMYDYQEEAILYSTAYEGVMCIASETKAKAISISGNDNYWGIWREAMAKYG